MRAGYVVYVPVEGQDGMTTVRFESLGKGQVTEEVVVQTKDLGGRFQEVSRCGRAT